MSSLGQQSPRYLPVDPIGRKMVRFEGSCRITTWAVMLLLAWGCATRTTTVSEPSGPALHSEGMFQRLSQEEQRKEKEAVPSVPSQAEGHAGQRSEGVTSGAESLNTEDEYLVATGHGLLSKGLLVCQRVADTAARAELAKLIRVYVEEHTVDRLRERSGSPAQQDIEVVREESAGELLQDVKIIDRRTDQAAGMCSSTAVMPKQRPSNKPEGRGIPNKALP